jgi:hypothetical protein
MYRAGGAPSSPLPAMTRTGGTPATGPLSGRVSPPDAMAGVGARWKPESTAVAGGPRGPPAPATTFPAAPPAAGGVTSEVPDGAGGGVTTEVTDGACGVTAEVAGVGAGART